MSDKIHLNLYVSGKNSRSEKARENLEAIFINDFTGRYELNVIDVLKNPELARQEEIVATPTLIRIGVPAKRLVGEFSDRQKVLTGLGLI